MSMQQALAPEDLSAIRLLPLPDLWPPPDSAQATVRECPRPAGTALAEQADARAGEQADAGQAWPRQFALLLAEALTGVRPVRQVLPWLSPRGTAHLRRLLPRFSGGPAARVQRILTTQPSPGVIEMTLIVTVGPRTRALAVRLTRAEPAPPRPWRGRLDASAEPRSAAPRWLCTDIEAA
jgi:hypothetical protein